MGNRPGIIPPLFCVTAILNATRYQMVTPAPNGTKYVPLVFLMSSQSFSTEMKIYFNKHRLPLVWEHEIKAGNVDSDMPAKRTDSGNALLLQLGPAPMIESPASADVVVKLPTTNTKIANGLVSVDDHTKIFSTVFHPLLDQKGLILWEIQKILGYIFPPIDWKDRLAPSTKVPFEYNRISPRGSVFV